MNKTISLFDNFELVRDDIRTENEQSSSLNDPSSSLFGNIELNGIEI